MVYGVQSLPFHATAPGRAVMLPTPIPSQHQNPTKRSYLRKWDLPSQWIAFLTMFNLFWGLVSPLNNE